MPASAEMVLRALEAASMDPQHWPDVCSALSQFLDARGGLILSNRPLKSGVQLPYSDGVAEVTHAYYKGGWHHADVRGERGLAQALLRGHVTDYDIMDETELLRHPFYAELLRPAGFAWFAATAVKVGGIAWAVSLQRTIKQGPFQREELEGLAALRSHLKLAIRRSIALGSQRVHNLEQTFAPAEMGFATIDDQGRIGYMNPVGEALLSAADALRGGRLSPSSQLSAASLQLLVDAATAEAEPGTRPAPPPVRLPTARGGAIVIDVVRMPRDFLAVMTGAVAIVTVRPCASLGISTDTLRSGFGLTHREAEICTLIAAGQSPETIASTLGSSVATIRQHLKSIFRKTGTHRQNELSALLTTTL